MNTTHPGFEQQSGGSNEVDPPSLPLVMFSNNSITSFIGWVREAADNWEQRDSLIHSLQYMYYLYT